MQLNSTRDIDSGDDDFLSDLIDEAYELEAPKDSFTKRKYKPGSKKTVSQEFIESRKVGAAKSRQNKGLLLSKEDQNKLYTSRLIYALAKFGEVPLNAINLLEGRETLNNGQLKPRISTAFHKSAKLSKVNQNPLFEVFAHGANVSQGRKKGITWHKTGQKNPAIYHALRLTKAGKSIAKSKTNKVVFGYKAKDSQTDHDTIGKMLGMAALGYGKVDRITISDKDGNTYSGFLRFQITSEQDIKTAPKDNFKDGLNAGLEPDVYLDVVFDGKYLGKEIVLKVKRYQVETEKSLKKNAELSQWLAKSRESQFHYDRKQLAPRSLLQVYFNQNDKENYERRIAAELNRLGSGKIGFDGNYDHFNYSDLRTKSAVLNPRGLVESDYRTQMMYDVWSIVDDIMNDAIRELQSNGIKNYSLYKFEHELSNPVLTPNTHIRIPVNLDKPGQVIVVGTKKNKSTRWQPGQEREVHGYAWIKQNKAYKPRYPNGFWIKQIEKRFFIYKGEAVVSGQPQSGYALVSDAIRIINNHASEMSSSKRVKETTVSNFPAAI